MFNLLLFLCGCSLIAVFAWYFWSKGQSALTIWVSMLSLFANLFVLKQIDLFNFNATASDVFAVGSLFGLNLLQEKFGPQAARQAIQISFGILVFFVLMSQIHLWYIPSVHDHTQEAYALLLAPAPRIMISSMFTFLVVQNFDSYLYAFLRKQFPALPMLSLSTITMGISQLLDTILFSFLALYGLMSNITDIIIVSYTIKLIAIGATVPWAFVTKRLFVK